MEFKNRNNQRLKLKIINLMKMNMKFKRIIKIKIYKINHHSKDLIKIRLK